MKGRQSYGAQLENERRVVRIEKLINLLNGVY